MDRPGITVTAALFIEPTTDIPPMVPDPDPGRARRLYAAEDRILRRHPYQLWPGGYDLPELPWPDVTRLTDRITHSAWYRDRWATTIHPVPIEGIWSYGLSDGRILLAPGGRNRLIVLHEISHVLTPGTGHGNRHLAVYIALVKHYLGHAFYRDHFRSAVTWYLNADPAAVPSPTRRLETTR